MSLSRLPKWNDHLLQWRMAQAGEPIIGLHTVMALILCFAAASISSAGGVGGGSLYLSILKLIVGMDLKDAASISAFMVTAGSMSNVIFNLLFTSMSKSPAIVDYDIALLSEPSMLLGVSFGVVCNVMFPEWLITALFTVLIAFSTYKTFQAGCKCWKAESDSVMDETVCRSDNQENNEPLLGGMSGKRGDGSIPWRKMAILLIIWVSFFVLHVLIANKDGKGMIHVKPCGLAYWLITLFQVPIVVGFTVFVLYDIGQLNNHQEPNPQKDDSEAETHKRVHDLPVVIFPFAALLSGILGGLFGVGGGLLINPFLIHAGVPPQVTAATTSFMVLFSSSMSLVQFLILGMNDIGNALIFAALCFVASIVGLVVIQRTIERSGRASLIVFSVATVMVLSTISITCFGIADVWRDFASGKNMGFKLPC